MEVGKNRWPESFREGEPCYQSPVTGGSKCCNLMLSAGGWRGDLYRQYFRYSVFLYNCVLFG